MYLKGRLVPGGVSSWEGKGVKQREGGTEGNSVGFQGALPILDT